MLFFRLRKKPSCEPLGDVFRQYGSIVPDNGYPPFIIGLEEVILDLFDVPPFECDYLGLALVP
jgi:hypothetical protein